MQCHAIPYNTLQYHLIPSNTIPCNTIQWHAKLCNTRRYNAIPCSTIRYNVKNIICIFDPKIGNFWQLVPYNALCGYPLGKVPVEKFLPSLPFSWDLIISDKIFGDCSLLSFTFDKYLGGRVECSHCRLGICNRISCNWSKLQERCE